MIIKTQKQLQNLIEEIQQTKRIAVDTEFYWMRTYYPELCLIQIATEDQIFIVDPLIDSIDFSNLSIIFEDNNIEKILHSAANDIPIIKKFLDCEINNIFDTQIAASFIGMPNQVSLKGLLQEVLNLDMEKESQFSDWRKRPLSNKQLEYAKKDVEHLIEIRDYLEKKLIEVSYYDYYAEDIADINQVGFNSIEMIHTKVGNIRKFNKKVQKNIILIARWRERNAQERNVTIRFLFDNKLLYQIAQIAPRSFDDFKSEELQKLNHHIKRGIIESLKFQENIDNLIDEQQFGIKISPILIDAVIAYFDKSTSKLVKFDTAIIASRKDIRSLIYNVIADNNYTDHKLLKGWRYQVIGKDLKKFILEKYKETDNSL